MSDRPEPARYHHHYGVTNPPRKRSWGLRWTGAWWDCRVQLYLVESTTPKIVDKQRFAYYVLMGGTGYVETDDRNIRAMPDAPIAIAPRTPHRLVNSNPKESARWLCWFAEEGE